MFNDKQAALTADLAWQRARLARWLVEWQLAEALDDGDGVDTESRPDGGAGIASLATAPDCEDSVQPGHIRLLAPEGAALSSRPLFVAVLEFDQAGLVQVAPFGRFSEPALPGEWLTGRDDLALRVLCLWNTRLMPATDAGRSWWVDSLSPPELAAARTVWSGLVQSQALAGDLARQVGPPVRHPDDPRWVYQCRERVYLDQVARELTSPYRIEETRDRRLAAETGPDENGFKPKP